jgi:hypothetical protein
VPLSSLAGTAFSEDRSISPKQFMFEKQPRIDVEKAGFLYLFSRINSWYTEYRSWRMLDNGIKGTA